MSLYLLTLRNVTADLEGLGSEWYGPEVAPTLAPWMTMMPFMPTDQTVAAAAISNIVVATDFSPSSNTALLYALGIARSNHAKVWIVHVVADAFFSSDTQQRAIDDAWREGHRRMTEHFIAGHLDGVQHKLLVEHGSTYDVLMRIVEEHEAGLLVLGTRGRSRIGKLLLGSVAESIFRQAPCPVMTIGPKTEMPQSPAVPQRILFCTGFSQHSLEAGRLAIRLAERQGGELILLHVAPESVTDRDAYARDANQRLAAIVPPDIKFAAAPCTLVEFGTAVECILAAAQEKRPDLIVLGVRQPESFTRRLRWATAYGVVTEAPCPVLTVRSSGNDS
jgi:nucleotide-binding universal stress UspA family protein